MNLERLKIIPQYLIPQHGLSQLLGRLADKELGNVTHTMINKFVKRYQVNMAEAANSDTASFATFNDFFTRKLKSGARSICGDNLIASPADGKVSQIGAIVEDRLIQAKGHNFSTSDLLGGNDELANKFQNGLFTTIYLSPKDYHRVHMPISGKLLSMHHIPGQLFSVNPLTARNVPNLFARNERVVCIFDTDIGLMAEILVGATIVGSVETVWHGTVTPPSRKNVDVTIYPATNSPKLSKGDEMGRFKLGSTVILLFQKDAMTFNEHIKPGQVLKMGEEIGKLA